ncbi:AhpC/TSA family protein [Orenia marismortui]|uniref:thioredoxin-dependent peroxiredoxin n=1 Tax=Orenia marismortui TaxID=46469 RepID=A0A4R8GVM1_9FIRM|nr:AhpC/TSA family protein [Orenia marismortui]
MPNQVTVVLVFYRDKWCPYCNLQLRTYQQALSKINDLGAGLISISPQTPDYSLTQKEKEELSYELLSDTKGEVAEKYNVLFDVPR